MDAFEERLNILLVETFRNVLKVEQEMVQNSQSMDLSINELHMLETIGKDREQGIKMSAIAEEHDITLPSVTIAINKLVKKGYVEKSRCQNDGRVVYVKLTKLGSKTEAAHRYFHKVMVRNVIKDLSEEEKDTMMKGIIKLDQFFQNKLDQKEK